MFPPEMLQWTKWAIHDERGIICGIQDDAPEDMKEQYQKCKDAEAEAKKGNYKF